MTALRVPVAMGSGTLIALVLFSVLWQFVSRAPEIPAPVDAKRLVFTRQIPSTTPTSRRDEKMSRIPPTLVPETPDIDSGHGDPVIAPPVRPTTGGAGDLLPSLPSTLPDRDAMAFVRVEPDYPVGAVTRGIEGWVLVQFKVNEIGAVADAFVVDSDPANVFDDAALKAVARWRYQPKVVDGAPVERVGLQTVFRFTLEE
jgi:periplasmic protein TonB